MKQIGAILLLLVLLFAVACDKEPFYQDKRSFYMGMTPYPPDFNDKSENIAYDFIDSHCDLIAHHFDEGIPWEEASLNQPYPEGLMNEIDKRIERNAGKKVYLAFTPLSTSRVEKVDLWGNYQSEEIKDKWRNLSFDDTIVSNAYINFCSFMIDKVNPDYFNYGIEANNKDWEQGEFSQYVLFCNRVYTALKAKYPGLPIFLSFEINLDDWSWQNAKELAEFSDFIAVSSYPYIEIGSNAYGSTDPIAIPSDWYTKFRDLAPEKPFAIAETGYIAEDLEIPELGVTKKGTKQWQADFLQIMFKEANELQVEFVIYWCAYDYDNGWNTLQALGISSPVFKLWKDIGLYDGNRLERPSLSTWEKWYKANKF